MSIRSRKIRQKSGPSTVNTAPRTESCAPLLLVFPRKASSVVEPPLSGPSRLLSPVQSGGRLDHPATAGKSATQMKGKVNGSIQPSDPRARSIRWFESSELARHRSGSARETPDKREVHPREDSGLWSRRHAITLLAGRWQAPDQRRLCRGPELRQPGKKDRIGG